MGERLIEDLQALGILGSIDRLSVGNRVLYPTPERSLVMADLMPFLLMNETQAARFREMTAGDENRLDPRKVDAGTYAGKYVLPKRVQRALEFEAHWDAFDMLTEVAIDRDVAWPPTEEEKAARKASQ